MDRLAVDVARVLAAHRRPWEELLDEAAEIVCHVTGGDLCVIGVLATDGASFHPLGVHHDDSEQLTRLNESLGLVWPKGRGFEQVLATREPRILGSVDLEAAFAATNTEPWRTALRGTGPHELMLVPIQFAGVSVGVMIVGRELPAPGYTSEDAQALEGVADVLALALRELHIAAGAGWSRAEGEAAGAGAPEFAGLTDREREIAVLLADGLTSREIAAHLYLSVRTVEWYRARVLGKLDHPSRAELVSLGRTLRDRHSRL
jgi:DNA-binding CsgD family transcriptional regulator